VASRHRRWTIPTVIALTKSYATALRLRGHDRVEMAARAMTFLNGIAISPPPGTSGLLALGIE
jgi:hypothetical protein